VHIAHIAFSDTTQGLVGQLSAYPTDNHLTMFQALNPIRNAIGFLDFENQQGTNSLSSEDRAKVVGRNAIDAGLQGTIAYGPPVISEAAAIGLGVRGLYRMATGGFKGFIAMMALLFAGSDAAKKAGGGAAVRDLASGFTNAALATSALLPFPGVGRSANAIAMYINGAQAVNTLIPQEGSPESKVS